MHLKLSPKVKAAAPYVLGALGLGAVVLIILRQRSASSSADPGTAYVHFGLNSAGNIYGGGASSSPASSSPPTDPGASSGRLRTLPCLIPPCPVADENGVITVPRDGGGVVTSPGSASREVRTGTGAAVLGAVQRFVTASGRKVSGVVEPPSLTPAWDPRTIFAGAQATAREVGRTVHPYGLGMAKSRMIDEG